MAEMRGTKEWLDSVWRESTALFHSIIAVGADAALEYTRWLRALRGYSESHRTGFQNKYRRYDRGDIVWVDFGWPVGHEHRGLHPGVVISRDDTAGESIITVIPLTSRAAKPAYGEVNLGRVAYGDKISTALVRQIRSVSKLRICGKLGHLTRAGLVPIEGEMLRSLVPDPGDGVLGEVAATRAPDGA